MTASKVVYVASARQKRAIEVFTLVLLSALFSGIIALLSYYVDQPLLYHRRVPSALWGLFIGVPAAFAVVKPELRAPSRGSVTEIQMLGALAIGVITFLAGSFPARFP